MLPAQTQIIEAIFTDAVRELAHSAPSSDATDISITLERTKIAAHGDLASTVALQQATTGGVSSRPLAEQLEEAVRATPRARRSCKYGCLAAGEGMGRFRPPAGAATGRCGTGASARVRPD